MMHWGSHFDFRWRVPFRPHLHPHPPHVGRVGTLAVALGIGTATVTGLYGACVARADSEGSSFSAGPANASASPSVNRGVRKPSKTTAVAAAAGSRRTLNAAPTKALPTSAPEPRGTTTPRRAVVELDGADSSPGGVSDRLPSPASTAGGGSHLATPGGLAATAGSTAAPATVPHIPSAKGQSRVHRIPAAGLTADGVPTPRSQSDGTALADSSVTVATPPIASASASVALSSVLASFFTPRSGVAPTIPVEAATALLAGAVWRQRDRDAEILSLSATQPAAEATTPTTVAVQAEKMTVSGAGRLVVDPTASGGSAVALSGVGAITATVALPDTTVLTVRVRASEGAPDMTVMIDGTAVTTLLVEARSYSDYKFAGAIAAGSHEISIISSTSTTRNVLYLDSLITSAGPIIDDFAGKSGSAPGSGIWTVRSGTNFDAGIQTYVAENAVLDGKGHLVLKAVKTKTGEYTSGWVWSKNNVSFGYGTITARIKMPKGQGLWPAFWLMGADSDTVGWPQSGEIDIAELPSTSTTIYSTLHGPIADGAGTQQAQIVSNVPDLSTAYHNYWVRHLENEITFGVDDLTLGTLTPESLDPGETWVYNRPMYAILNLGVGGPWAGEPRKSTRFPAKMLVDSVRWDAA